MLFNLEALTTEKIYKGSVYKEKNPVVVSDAEMNVTCVNLGQCTELGTTFQPNHPHSLSTET